MPGTDRLDAEKLETLRAWGEGLAADSREEVRAAGRAVLLLAEEIDRLYVDLWHARTLTPVEAEEELRSDAEVSANMVAALRRRVERLRRPRKAG
jgi:hypothetical protein